MPEIIAVRRNLTPGAVFFRQIGRVVEYSLDRVTWIYAFELPRGSGTTISQDVYNSLENFTLQQFINLNTSIYNTPSAVTTTTIDQIAAGAGRIERNLCSASKALAAAAATLINLIIEEEGDAQMRADAAVSKIVGGGLGVGATVAWNAKWLTPKVAGFLGLMAAAITVTADVIDFVASLDNVPDILTDDDIDVMACYLYRTTQVNPNVGREGLSLALSSQQFPELPLLPQGTTTAFYDIMQLTPELYSEFLAMTLDADETTCECGGCITLKPWDAEIINNSGYKLLNGGVKSTPDYSPYTPTNYKYLWLRFAIPTGQQIDSVTVNFTTTQYIKSSALNWGTTTVLGVTASGLYGGQSSAGFGLTIGQVSDYTINNTTNSGGVKSFTFDFSGITFTNGTTGELNITHRLSYVANGLGADTIFTGGKICFRGP